MTHMIIFSHVTITVLKILLNQQRFKKNKEDQTISKIYPIWPYPVYSQKPLKNNNNNFNIVHHLYISMLVCTGLFAVWFNSLWCIFPAGTMKGRSLGVLCSLCSPIPPVHHSARSSQPAKFPPSRPSSSCFGHSAQLRVTRGDESIPQP